MSTSGFERPRMHRRPSVLCKDRTYKANWIRSLQRKGLDYKITILEEVPSVENLASAEVWWVLFGRACGWPLTNLTNGGEGTVGVVRSAETRARIVAALTGRKRSLESRQRQSTTLKQRGHKPSLEIRTKGIAAVRGKPVTLSQSLAVSKSNKARIVTAETRAKMSASRSARPNSPETRAKISAAKRLRDTAKKRVK